MQRKDYFRLDGRVWNRWRSMSK